MTEARIVGIGPLYRSDAEACAALERLLFAGDDPWSAQAFRDALAAGHHYLAAREGDRVVGYAGLALVGGPPRPEAEVHTIAVHPRRQRCGLGGRLLRGLLARADDWAAAVFLEVRQDNEPALALYRRYGFAVVGTRPRYYQPSGADAYTMRRPPPDQAIDATNELP